MTKKSIFIKIISIAIIIATISISAVGIYAAFENAIIEAQEKEIEKSINQAVSEAADDDFSADGMFKLLETIYPDEEERYKAIEDYGFRKAIDNITSEQSQYLCSVVKSSNDYFLTMSIYEFWQTTSEPIDIIGKIYELYDEEYRSIYWIEDAFNIITENRHGVLDKAGIDAYIEKGLTTEDILYANIMSRKGVLTINEILDQRADKKAWLEITSEIYPELNEVSKSTKSDYEVGEIFDAVYLSEKTGISALKYLKARDSMKKHKVAYSNDIFTETNKKLLKKGYTKRRENPENKQFNEDMEKLIKAEGVTKEEIEQLMDEGEDMVSIYNAAKVSKKRNIPVRKAFENKKPDMKWSDVK